jgi:hypothetical protein
MDNITIHTKRKTKEMEEQHRQRHRKCYGSTRTVFVDFVSRLLLQTVTCLLTFSYDSNQYDRGVGVYKLTGSTSLSGFEQLCDC